MNAARLSLGHLGTPIVRLPTFDAFCGASVWVKRDDMTGGPEAGNKIRKLEFLLADALEKGANVVVTCGGLQSNHARATAAAAARLGLACELFLRKTETDAATDGQGNVFLDRLFGARIERITAEAYARRGALLRERASELTRRGARPYVIPEGGSNAVGSLGYVQAMHEIREQIDSVGSELPSSFDAIVMACGSGGTAAGTAVGAKLFELADRIWPIAVCNDSAYFEAAIDRIMGEMGELDPSLARRAEVRVYDGAKGPMYGVSTAEQIDAIAFIARDTGLVLDPVYTGKAAFGLRELVKSGAIAPGSRVLFLHTGGLPGLLAQTGAFRDVLP